MRGNRGGSILLTVLGDKTPEDDEEEGASEEAGDGVDEVVGMDIDGGHAEEEVEGGEDVHRAPVATQHAESAEHEGDDGGEAYVARWEGCGWALAIVNGTALNE